MFATIAYMSIREREREREREGEKEREKRNISAFERSDVFSNPSSRRKCD